MRADRGAEGLKQRAIDRVFLRIDLGVPLHAQRKARRVGDADGLDRLILGHALDDDALARLEDALPVQRVDPDGLGAEELRLDGSERFALRVSGPLRPGVTATLNIERQDGRRDSVPLVVRIDTPIEAAYFSAGGILPYVLEQLIADAPGAVP